MLVNEKLEQYALSYSTRPSALLLQLEAETWAKTAVPYALSGPLVGQFLRLLVQLMGASRILEIGTFTGYATLSMAEALPSEGEIWTCEIDLECISFASSFFERSPHMDQIHVLAGDALTTLQTLEPGFDLVFIDADKENYPLYYEESMRLAREGGCLVIDNAFARGGVLNPQSLRSRAIHALNEKIAGDYRVESVILTVRDGLQVVRKRGRAVAQFVR